MFSRFCIVFLFVNIFSDILALVELPQVEENNILVTDTAVRQTTNELFSLLKLKLNKGQLNLKQYSLIHNYLVSTSLQDYTNLKEIAKLTRVDKTRLKNETCNFMAIVNEILNEDINHDTVTEDEYVIRHIEGFLSNLDKYTGQYEYSETVADDILIEIVKVLEKNDTFTEALNKTENSDRSWLESGDEDGNIIDDNEFWVPNTRRIFQGHKSTIKDFPFMASILVFNHFQCAGSIIKSDLIITAASCLQLTWNNRFFRENPKFLTTRVGSSFHNSGGENIDVLEIYFHPDYDPKSLRNNLCLLRLQRRLKFTSRKSGKNFKKIEVDRKPNALPVMALGGGGITITIVGWGAKGINPDIKDQYLSFAMLDIYPVIECQTVYSAEYVTQKHFCAGFLSRGGGACSRDIGGPGIMNGILVGIISFGSPACGTPDAPTVFTKVGFYTDWIDSIIRQNVVTHKKRTTKVRQLDFTSAKIYTTIKTTYKMQPITFTKKKKAERDMDQIEILRTLKDKGLLKKFVDTVIGSEEARDWLREEAEKDNNTSILAAVTATKPMSGIRKNISEESLNIYHKLSSETIEELSELEPDTNIKTNIDKELETQIEKDIMDILENMNDLVNDSQIADITQVEKKADDIDANNLLRLMILSEGNNSTDAISDEYVESNETGIEIPLILQVQNTSDINYRNNGTDNEIFLSKQDLIELFSEALREEFQLKNNITTGILFEGSETSKSTTKPNTTKMQQKGMRSHHVEKAKGKSVFEGK